MKIINLNGKWNFRAFQKESFSAVKDKYPQNLDAFLKWMPGTVPGTIHTDLFNLKKIDNPFYRANENDLQWIDKINWKYEREFFIYDSFIEDSVELVAEGLDTFTEIYINDNLVSKTNNMFIEHRFDIRYLLMKGLNKISILFCSPSQMANELLDNSELKGSIPENLPRIFCRKAQYSFGWDWGPTFITSGIWKSIRIESHSKEKIQSASFRTLQIKDNKAKIEFSVNCLNTTEGEIVFRISHKNYLLEFKRKVFSDFLTGEFIIENAKLWMPNGYGEPNIYNIELSLNINNNTIDRYTTYFGIRIIKLIQEPDPEGQSFIFEINSTKIFCKGANWIPNDSFLPRITSEKIFDLLKMAKNANMNMLRVWGGGIYESDEFYRYCDEMGIIIWQDFMFACSHYPENDAFISEITREAIYIINRLINHPSIIIWCGNNECEWLWEMSTKSSFNLMPGAKIFDEILPTICKEQDPSRPYFRSSPFGGESPNDEKAGDHHQWDVWSGWYGWRHYKNIRGKFISEFGFQSTANYKTMAKVLAKKDECFQCKVMEHHNKQINGTERLFGQLSTEFKVDGNFKEMIYKLQLNQAEAIKFGVEHWRRRKFLTAGTLFWQINDCWPVSSWSAIDYDLRPKALYYFSKRFYNPVLLSFEETEDKIKIWVTNDLLIDIEGRLNFSHLKFNGQKIISASFIIKVPENSSQIVFSLNKNALDMTHREYSLLFASLNLKKKLNVSNTFFFEKMKHLNFPEPVIKIKIAGKKKGGFILELSSSCFAKAVQIENSKIDFISEDNFFDLFPGNKKCIKINVPEKISVNNFLKNISVHYLK